MLAELHDYHSYIDSLSSFYSNNTITFDYRLKDDDFFIALFKMIHLDVNPLIASFPDFYSSTGRPATYQIEIFRSLILMVHFRYLSIKKWANKLTSDKWKTIYKNRTSCERINNRIINDYHFLDSKIHGRKRNMFLLILIGINIHLDTYYKESKL